MVLRLYLYEILKYVESRRQQMALHFTTNAKLQYEIAITTDPALNMNDDEKISYLNTGDNGLLKIKEGQEPTFFVIHALTPSDRETAELKAGAYTRSELGRILWVEEPSNYKEKAYWREALSDMEKKALSDYESYLNRVYSELVKASLIEIKGVAGDPWDLIQMIRPDSIRLKAISELVYHIQRLSLLSEEGK